MPAPKGHPPYNKNGEGGRPPLHTKEFIENEAEEFLKWMQLPDSVFYKDFAVSRGYKAQYLSKWANENERFNEVWELSKDWQESRLVKYALFKTTDSSMTKFTLLNHHNWRDKQETVVLAANQTEIGRLLAETQGTSKDLVDDSKE